MVLGASSHLRAHGSMAEPISRVYQVFLENPQSPTSAAGQAAVAAAGTQAFYDWHEVSLLAPARNYRELIPDGQLPGVGRDKYEGLNLVRLDWPATKVAAGDYDCTFYAATPHDPSYFEAYLTKADYDPTQPLRWDDLDLLPYVQAPVRDGNNYRFTVNLPERTGRQILYVVWQRVDPAGEAFFSTSDLDFGGFNYDPALVAPTSPDPVEAPLQGTPMDHDHGMVDPMPVSPTDSVVDAAVATQGLLAQPTIVNDWGSGAEIMVTLSNPGATAITDWSLSFDLPGEIGDIWNATLSTTATSPRFTVTPPSWSNQIASGGTATFGFVFQSSITQSQLEAIFSGNGVSNTEPAPVYPPVVEVSPETTPSDDSGMTDHSDHEMPTETEPVTSDDSAMTDHSDHEMPHDTDSQYSDITIWGTLGGSMHTTHAELVGGRTPITTEALAAYNDLRAFLGYPAIAVDEVGRWAFTNGLTNNAQAWGDDVKGVGLWYAMQGAKVGWIRDEAYDPQILADIQRTARLGLAEDVLEMVRIYGHVGFADYLINNGLDETFVNTTKMEPHYGGWMHDRAHGMLPIAGVAIAHDVNHLTVLSHDQTQPFMNDTFDWPQWPALEVPDADVIDYFHSMVVLGDPVGDNIETSDPVAVDLEDEVSPTPQPEVTPEDELVVIDPVVSPEVTPEPAPEVSSPGSPDADFMVNGIRVEFRVASDWGSGLTANVTLVNTTNIPIDNWVLGMDLPSNPSIVWSSEHTRSGDRSEFRPVAWNGSLAPGARVSFGFNSSPGNLTSAPQNLTVNGVTATVDSSPAPSMEPDEVADAGASDPLVPSLDEDPLDLTDQVSSTPSTAPETDTVVGILPIVPIVPGGTSPSPVTASPGAPPLDGPKIVGYFVEWGIYGRDYNVSDIPAEKLNVINYAFANISDAGEVVLYDSYAAVEKAFPGDSWDEPLRGNFKQLIKLKEQHPHLITMISVGGWTLSGRFSDAALTAEARARFAQSAVDFMLRYGFDGVDIDWEYPVAGGLASNVYRPEDKQNYTLLLRELRNRLDARGSMDGRKYYLSIAAPAGDDKVRNLEPAGIAAACDWINIMTYDFAGGWEKETGHHAPIFSPEGSGAPNPTTWWSVDGAVRQFLNAGAQPEKLVVGVPFYGRGWSGVPDINSGLGQTSTGLPQGSYEPGMFDYKDLVTMIEAQPDLYEVFEDTGAEATFLYAPAANGLWVTFDDTEMMRRKMEYIKDMGLGGAMFWELSGDTQDPSTSLLEVIHQGLGPNSN